MMLNHEIRRLQGTRMTLKAIWTEIILAARETPRLYFAPLAGACRAVRREMRRIDARCRRGRS